MGGTYTLAHIVDGTVSAVNIDRYADLVIEKWQWRAYRDAICESSNTFNDSFVVADKAALDGELSKITDRLIKLRGLGAGGGLIKSGDLAAELFEQIEERIVNPEKIYESYLPTGFNAYDRESTGIPVGLTTLAARPAMGKTAFALNLALNAAKAGKSVLVFSLEMTSEQLGIRLLASLAQIGSNRLERGRLEEPLGEPARLINAVEMLGNLPLEIDESAHTYEEILAVIENWRLTYGRSPDLVVVDYLQLIEMEDRRLDSRQKINRIVKGLGSYFTKTLKSSCVLLSQLNRGVEQRTDKRPLLSDLRESGEIEEASAVVLALYREAYYNKGCGHNEVELITLKNRFSGVGTVNLAFQPETSTFYDQ